jgi:type I restriction enzyme S subunit
MTVAQDDLPNGWQLTNVGAVITDIQTGFASGVHNSEGTGLPHLRPMNVSTRGKIERTVIKSVDPSLADRPERRLQRGDVLFNNTNSLDLVGKTAYFNDEDSPAFSNHMTRLRTDSRTTDPAFLARYLHACWTRGDFTQLANNHVSQASVGRKVLAAMPMPLPPLPEQRDITRLLDEIDEHRDAAVTHLAQARQILNDFRQAVLTEAYSSALEETGAVPLSELLRSPLKNGYSASPVPYVTEFKVLTLTATTSGYFDGTQFKYTDEVLPDDSEAWVQPGDILVQRGNTAEYVGVPAIYDGRPKAFIYPDLMIRIRPKADIDPRFLWYMLLAPASRNFLRQRATGSAGNMPKINQKILKALPVPCPSLEAQHDVVRRVDALLRGSAQVQEQIEHASKLLDRTGQAALAKAFRGELSA